MSKLKSLSDLLLEELREIYNAENQLVKALPKMAEAAHSVGLQEAFEFHLQETKGHIRRLKSVFAMLRVKPVGKQCDAMEGLVLECEKMIDGEGAPEVRDAGLIAAAQRIEHFEISAYGTAREFAATLGLVEIAALLQETLDEEGATDTILTRLAKSINLAAVEEGQGLLMAW